MIFKQAISKSLESYIYSYTSLIRKTPLLDHLWHCENGMFMFHVLNTQLFPTGNS